ncbi:MAG: hypothetical protein VX874_15700 [Pseudomonadota bacterium]|nr:hypothetical protein [Pseudomonadota bacterium]
MSFSATRNSRNVADVPAEQRPETSRARSTAGGGATSTPGFFQRILNALRGRPAAGAITHGNARRQRARENASANLALDALSDLPPGWAMSVIRAHLRTRDDIEAGALHDLANQLSRYADELERTKS